MLIAWLGSQHSLFLLLFGLAAYSSAVLLFLLLRNVSAGLPKSCPDDARRAAGKTLLTQMAKALAVLAAAGWIGSPRAR